MKHSHAISMLAVMAVLSPLAFNDLQEKSLSKPLISRSIATEVIESSPDIIESVETTPTSDVSADSEDLVCEDTDAAMCTEKEENKTEETVAENTAEVKTKEAVAEDKTEETVAENTAEVKAEETVAEDKSEEAVAEDKTEETVAENTAEVKTEEAVAEVKTEEAVAEDKTEEAVAANTAEVKTEVTVNEQENMCLDPSDQMCIENTAASESNDTSESNTNQIVVDLDAKEEKIEEEKIEEEKVEEEKQKEELAEKQEEQEEQDQNDVEEYAEEEVPVKKDSRFKELHQIICQQSKQIGILNHNVSSLQSNMQNSLMMLMMNQMFNSRPTYERNFQGDFNQMGFMQGLLFGQQIMSLSNILNPYAMSGFFSPMGSNQNIYNVSGNYYGNMSHSGNQSFPQPQHQLPRQPMSTTQAPYNFQFNQGTSGQVQWNGIQSNTPAAQQSNGLNSQIKM